MRVYIFNTDCNGTNGYRKHQPVNESTDRFLFVRCAFITQAHSKEFQNSSVQDYHLHFSLQFKFDFENRIDTGAFTVECLIDWIQCA